jgi:hypothetical protein
MSNVFSNMDITPLAKPMGTLIANGSVDMGNMVKIRFTVIKGPKGVFASLPARKGTKPDAQGKIPWYPEVKIINDELYNEFQSLVKKELAKKLSEGKSGNSKKAGEEKQSSPYDDDAPF